jgi:predicted RNA methylase
MPLNFYWMTLSENKSFTDKGIYLKILCMSSIFTKSFLILLKAVKAARGGKYVHRELIGTVTDKKGKIRNKWKYFYNQGTLQQELAAWKAGFERKQAKQKRNLFATPADIKGVSNVDKILAEHPNLRTATITPKVRHTIQDVTPEGYGPDELPKQTSVATPQPTSPKVEPVQTVSFDDHIASQNLTPKQLEVSKQVYNTVKDLPESELRVRLDRLSKLPASNGIAGITAINYVLGLTRSEAMLGNQNAAGRHNVESRTIPELNEVLASTSDKDYMANVITQIETNRIPQMTIDNLKSAIAALPVKDSSIIEKLVRSMITQNQVNYNKTVIPNPISDKFREEQLKKNNEALSNKFNALADAMEKTIDSKINSAIGQRRTTARRARIAGGMADEGYHLQEIQSVLRGMANAIKNNDLPKELQNIKSRSDLETVYDYSGYQKQRPESDYVTPFINDGVAREALGGRYGNAAIRGLTPQEKRFLERYTRDGAYYLHNESDIQTYKDILAKARKQNKLKYMNKGDEKLRLHSLGIKTKQQLIGMYDVLRSLRHGYTAPDPKLKKIKDLETKLIGQKIPDFFPTPKRIIEDMISRADIQSGMKVLEPSAGKGDIADALKEAGAEVDTIEPVYSLSDILKEKGHNVLDTQDFLDLNEKYDRIVMNPPFGRGADMKHVRHAYDLLKPGGKLVAIMGEGGFFRSDNQSKEFREWLDSVNSDVEKLPEGSFRGVDSFVQTGVNTRMVTITKPVENNFETMPDSKPQENNFDTMPETKQEEKSAVPTGVKIESNGNSQVVKSSSVNPDTKEIIYTVENRDGIETKVPESKVKILPVTQTTEVKKVIESAEPSNRMSIEKQLIGKPENVTSIKDDIAEKSKAPIAYIEKEITTLSGIKIKAIDYSSVPINEIQIIDAENILTTPKPSYIPEINERDFEIKSYFLEFVKAPDGNFIVPLNWYVPKVQNKAREQEPKYAIMSLENIVATTEYYRTKKLEEGRDKATKNNIANVEKILTWDQKTREYYKPFNYTRLSESQKKKYSEEAWNKLSETEKLKEVPKMKNPPIHINPIPRLKIGLKEMSMLVSTFHLYNELVDSSYSIPSRAAGYNPKDQVAIDFNSIREDYKQKVEDMKIQKEEDSASYKQALETSFGMSKTKNDLFESHGILVKSQNGKEVNRDQVKDISEAMNLVYSVFGDKKQLSKAQILKFPILEKSIFLRVKHLECMLGQWELLPFPIKIVR